MPIRPEALDFLIDHPAHVKCDHVLICFVVHYFQYSLHNWLPPTKDERQNQRHSFATTFQILDQFYLLHQRFDLSTIAANKIDTIFVKPLLVEYNHDL